MSASLQLLRLLVSTRLSQYLVNIFSEVLETRSTLEPINSARLRVAFNWLTVKGKFVVKLNRLFLLERPLKLCFLSVQNSNFTVTKQATYSFFLYTNMVQICQYLEIKQHWA